MIKLEARRVSTNIANQFKELMREEIRKNPKNNKGFVKLAFVLRVQKDNIQREGSD